MFPFKKSFPTPRTHSAGKNACKYIIVHHTATDGASIKGVIRELTIGIRASAHFVIDTNGDAYKIGNPTDILWHAGESRWGDLKGMNQYSMGIEIVGPQPDGGFTPAQKDTARKLIQHLMAVFNIPQENVLKHADLTWAGSAEKKNWDWKSSSRKVDVARTFVREFNNSWREYQLSLVPKQL